MMLGHRFIGLLLAAFMLAASISLMTDIKPELKLIAVAAIGASTIGLAIIFRKLRKGADGPAA